ncbi:HNH endonuclease [Halocalculus aciditolerans]|uniref:C2H2-type domain-containing protein n=1 Tax=Halocalculus aciditolerans TaxID=1383812 RepID=A0A830FJB3_9EURY|nr:HNH endonuclease signature motif containing protein [Halocalculus aciditolerans]GGL61787.1 hypothetical protein GCM10009039_19970 [Halocalculus aciditolerans]
MDCPTCGTPLRTEQGVRQHHTKVHGDPLPNRTCTGCDVEFYDPKARREFCDDCNPNAGEHNGNYRDAKETTECRQCGSEFDYYPSDKDGVYCPDCVAAADEFLGTPSYEINEAPRITRECDYCEAELVVLQSERDRGQGRFCSCDCLYSWMSEELGPGVDPNVYSGRWREARRKTLERDDHACQNCGSARDELGQEPDVHHLTPVREFDDPQDSHVLSNLVSLCRSCHMKVERGTVVLSDET